MDILALNKELEAVCKAVSIGLIMPTDFYQDPADSVTIVMLSDEGVR